MNAWSSWEDWRAGMYAADSDSARSSESVALLSDPEMFREVATEMLREWPHAAAHNLVNMWSGRNAWIGQAACSYAHGATSTDTRSAWGQLTNEHQRRANEVARSVRVAWEKGRQDAQAVFDL